MIFSYKGTLAVQQPKFTKIETRISSGFAVNSNRADLIELDLIMDYDLNGVQLIAGTDKVLIRGDSGLAAWAKAVYEYEGKAFVLMPETSILGYVRNANN